MSIITLLHLYAVVIWIGGMFFAHMVLRPSAMQVLEGAPRLRLWLDVFTRFFRWVWLSVVVLLVSGLYLMHLRYRDGGMTAGIQFMAVTGMLMMVIYSYLYFGCYMNLRKQLAVSDIQGAAATMLKIRSLVGVNLVLGVVTIAVAVIF